MVLESSSAIAADVGTVAYMAPEIMDIYSSSQPEEVCLLPVRRDIMLEQPPQWVTSCPTLQLQDQGIDGTKCDVFSFAILTLYVATGCTPYDGLNHKQIFLKVYNIM